MKHSPRILIVDDEPANRRLLHDLVIHEGCVPLMAEGGDEALRILDRDQPDVVLLDLHMPGADGMTVLAALQASGRLPGLPVVVVTADDSREARGEALKRGAIDFLTKPLDRLEVACKIRGLAELSRLRGLERYLVEQEAARRAYERFETALHGLPVCVYESVLTPDGSVLPTWLGGDFAGELDLKSGGRVSRECWLDYMDPDDRSEVQRIHAEIAAGERTEWSLQYRWRHPQQGVRWVLEVGRYHVGSRTMRGAILDVSEQRRLHEALLQSQKMECVGRLAGGVAHDFNNLLTVITGYADLLAAKLAPGDSPLALLRPIQEAASRAAELTKQLLVFSRKQDSRMGVLDLNEEILRLESMLRRLIHENIRLELDLRAPNPRILAARGNIGQIVMNLVVNARDAMPGGGSLTISTAAGDPDTLREGSVRLHVRDTGHGMDEATRKRLFEPFFTTKEPGKGTGLGLSTVQAIVRQCGGRIEVESRPAAGTEIRICFPNATAPSLEEAVDPAVAAVSVQANETILIVEDEAAVLAFCATVLTSQGYTVLEAIDGHQALQVAEGHSGTIHLIVSDSVLPGLSGEELLTSLLSRHPQAKVLLVSGYSDERRLPPGSAGPRHVFLQKPFSIEDLLRTVRELLDGPRPAE